MMRTIRSLIVPTGAVASAAAISQPGNRMATSWKESSRESHHTIVATAQALRLTAGLARRRHDPFQPHVGDEVAVVLVAVLDVEVNHRQLRRRAAEELYDRRSLRIVEAVDDLVAVGDRVVER